MKCLNCKTELTELDFNLLKAELRSAGVPDGSPWFTDALSSDILCACCRDDMRSSNNYINRMDEGL